MMLDDGLTPQQRHKQHLYELYLDEVAEVNAEYDAEYDKIKDAFDNQAAALEKRRVSGIAEVRNRVIQAGVLTKQEVEG